MRSGLPQPREIMVTVGVGGQQEQPGQQGQAGGVRAGAVEGIAQEAAQFIVIVGGAIGFHRRSVFELIVSTG
jgi:hypothetical protein